MSKKDGKPSNDKGPKRSREPEPETDGDSREGYVDIDDPAAAILDSAVKSTPWWAISLAFHGLVLAALPLIIFSVNHFEKDCGIQSIVIRPPQPKLLSSRDDGPHGLNPDEINMPNPEHPTEEQRIYFPGAVEGDHNELDTGEEFASFPSGAEAGLSCIPGTDGGIGRQPGKGPGVTDVMGVGGGGGGSRGYSGRGGGKQNLVARGHGSTRTQNAVECGLRWLARHQGQDGSWSATSFTANCKGTTCNGSGEGDFDVGVTGLAVLAFLGSGITPSNRATYIDPVTGLTMRQGEVVRKGLKFLMDKQDRQTGLIGPQVQELMYNHAIAALALCEAYGITNAVTYRKPAQDAVMFVNTAQNYGLGWRYTPHSGANDTSVTGWCVMVLKSAQISGLDVSQTAFDGARNWIVRATDPSGKTGYDRVGSGDVVAAGKNEAWASHPSMTAVGLLSRIFIDKKKGDAAMSQAANILLGDLPRWDPKSQHPTNDNYYWYYGTLAMFQYDGPSGPQWKKWNTAMIDALCPTQCTKKDGCADGSWPTEQVDRWGYAGGRVYATAINVLTLEVYYRYASVFGSREGGK